MMSNDIIFEIFVNEVDIIVGDNNDKENNEDDWCW